VSSIAMPGDAFPLLSTNPTVGRNNSRDFRKLWFQGLMFGPGAGGFTRRGVIHRGWIGGTSGVEPQELKVLETAVPNGQVRVNPGLFVVHRGQISGIDEGPVWGGSQGTTPIPTTDLPAAPVSNTRYDGIFAKIMDKNLAADSAGADHGPYIDWISGVAGASLNISGTPGSAGAPPATPDGYLPLAFIARATNDNTISQAEITDVRRCAYLAGTPRVLFPWDISGLAGDTGYMLGEERIRPAAAPYPSFLDRWDGVEWRGTQDTTLDITTGPAVSVLGINTITEVMNKTIADPGFKYRVWVGATVGFDSDANAIGEASLRMTNSAGAAIGLLGEDPLFAAAGSGSANKKRQVVMAPRPTAILSGSSVISLCLRRLSGGSQLGALANISQIYATVIPA